MRLRPIPGEEFGPIPKDSVSVFFTEKEKQSERGFSPTHLPEGILESVVLCSCRKRAMENDGWVQC